MRKQIKVNQYSKSDLKTKTYMSSKNDWNDSDRNIVDSINTIFDKNSEDAIDMVKEVIKLPIEKQQLSQIKQTGVDKEIVYINNCNCDNTEGGIPLNMDDIYNPLDETKTYHKKAISTFFATKNHTHRISDIDNLDEELGLVGRSLRLNDNVLELLGKNNKILSNVTIPKVELIDDAATTSSERTWSIDKLIDSFVPNQDLPEILSKTVSKITFNYLTKELELFNQQDVKIGTCSIIDLLDFNLDDIIDEEDNINGYSKKVIHDNFSDIAHTHTMDDIENLSTTLTSIQDNVETLIDDVTDLQTRSTDVIVEPSHWSDNTFVLNPEEPEEDQITDTRYETTITHDLNSIKVFVNAIDETNNVMMVNVEVIDENNIKLITFNKEKNIHVKISK